MVSHRERTLCFFFAKCLSCGRGRAGPRFEFFSGNAKSESKSLGWGSVCLVLCGLAAGMVVYRCCGLALVGCSGRSGALTLDEGRQKEAPGVAGGTTRRNDLMVFLPKTTLCFFVAKCLNLWVGGRWAGGSPVCNFFRGTRKVNLFCQVKVRPLSQVGFGDRAVDCDVRRPGQSSSITAITSTSIFRPGKPRAAACIAVTAGGGRPANTSSRMGISRAISRTSCM